MIRNRVREVVEVSKTLAGLANYQEFCLASVLRLSMSSRFEFGEHEETTQRQSLLVDSEAFDAREQNISTSLDQAPSSLGDPETAEATASEIAAGPFQPDLLGEVGPLSWRDEVAAKLTNYRARRRPLEPRYPSMRLKFGPSDPSAVTLARRQSVTVESSIRSDAVVTTAAVTYPEPSVPQGEPSAKIIEFPRSQGNSQSLFDELAEPVFDRPRILEAPELVPPAPALGGILLEAAVEEPDERRPGFEVPLQPAPMIRRVLAVTTDAVFVAAAFASFAYIFLKVNSTMPVLTQAAGISAGLLGFFWAGYQYLLLVHAGSTPGLKLAKLELSRFDGAPVPRNIRRWRVLASILSGVSVGLGYAWCLLDEDQLCWHDRITRTYMAPRK